MNFDDGSSYTHFCYAKSSKQGSYLFSVDKKILGAKVCKSFFALSRRQKHKTRCFSRVQHRQDLKKLSEAMNFDDGSSYTHFCYAKSSKKGSCYNIIISSYHNIMILGPFTPQLKVIFGQSFKKIKELFLMENLVKCSNYCS